MSFRFAAPLGSLAAAVALFTTACSDSATSPLDRMHAGNAAYAAHGNSDAAHLCQQGGFANIYRADGTHFTNPGECTDYAAQGGTLSHPVTFSDIQLGGCNANAFGYEVGGVQTELFSKSEGCPAGGYIAEPTTTVYVPLGQTARVYLRDNSCGYTFYEDDGTHGLVTGTNPYAIKINDAGGGCWLPPSVNTWDPNSPDPRLRSLTRSGNLNLTKTVL